MQRTDVTRRVFIARAGLGTGAGVGIPALFAVGTQSTRADSASVQVVNDLMAGFVALDWTKVAACLTDDCLFRVSEVGRTPPAASKATVMKDLVERSSQCEMRIVETFVSGPIVMHERYDRWTFKSDLPPLLWHGIGVYAVAGGRVAEWIDYTLGRPNW